MKQVNYTKQAYWVALGSLFAFGFTMVSSMVLGRYFNKSDYGTYKQVLYVYSTFCYWYLHLAILKHYAYFLPVH